MGENRSSPQLSHFQILLQVIERGGVEGRQSVDDGRYGALTRVLDWERQ